MWDCGKSYSFVTKSMLKSNKWLMDSTELISIHLTTGSEVVLDSICTVPIVFCDSSGHAISYHIARGLQKTYPMIFSLVWIG